MLSELGFEGGTLEEAEASEGEPDGELFYDYQPVPLLSRLVTQDEYFLTRVSVATSFSRGPPTAGAASGSAAAGSAGSSSLAQRRG